MESDPFEDAKTLCERGKRHYGEFNSVVSPQAQPSVWSIDERADAIAGDYTYTLLLNRQVLRQAKPILADMANNLVHALDQLVGAAARLRGHPRFRHLYFPWTTDDQRFAEAINKLSPIIGEDKTKAIQGARDRNRPWIENINWLKDISNSGKHWELVASSSHVVAVQVRIPGGPHKIFELPPDVFERSDSHEFAVGVPCFPNAGFEILLSFGFEGLTADGRPSVDSIFSCGYRYVSEMIDAVSAASEGAG